MIKTVLISLTTNIRELTRNWHALVVLAALFTALLATLYGFVATREATIWQVLLTLLFIAAAPAWFFLLQAAILSYARETKIVWYRSLRDSCTLALVSLPLILAGLALISLLGKWQAHFPLPTPPSYSGAAPNFGAAAQSIHWPTLVFATLRGLLFGVVLPLTAIHFWAITARDGLRKTIRNAGEVLTHAFAAQSVAIYAIGLIVFAAIPYALVFIRIPTKGAWTEIGVFTTRLVLVAGFALAGWLMTVSTLTRGVDAAIPAPEAGSEAD